jgi:diketogulonate reductase-like aldo/keto reductase
VRRLADSNEMPVLGLGLWQVPNGPECENAVRWALEDMGELDALDRTGGTDNARERKWW